MVKVKRKGIVMNGSKTSKTEAHQTAGLRAMQKNLEFAQRYGGSSKSIGYRMQTMLEDDLQTTTQYTESLGESINLCKFSRGYLANIYEIHMGNLSHRQKMKIQEMYSKHPYIVKEWASKLLLGVPLNATTLGEHLGDLNEPGTAAIKEARVYKLAGEVKRFVEKTN